MGNSLLTGNVEKSLITALLYCGFVLYASVKKSFGGVLSGGKATGGERLRKKKRAERSRFL